MDHRSIDDRQQRGQVAQNQCVRKEDLVEGDEIIPGIPLISHAMDFACNKIISLFPKCKAGKRGCRDRR